jgi:hypothetical protein
VDTFGSIEYSGYIGVAPSALVSFAKHVRLTPRELVAEVESGRSWAEIMVRQRAVADHLLGSEARKALLERMRTAPR